VVLTRNGDSIVLRGIPAPGDPVRLFPAVLSDDFEAVIDDGRLVVADRTGRVVAREGDTFAEVDVCGSADGTFEIQRFGDVLPRS
jgi:hypothetical protein